MNIFPLVLRPKSNQHGLGDVLLKGTKRNSMTYFPNGFICLGQDLIWSIHIEWAIDMSLSLLNRRCRHICFFFLQLIDEIRLLVLCSFPLSGFYGLS